MSEPIQPGALYVVSTPIGNLNDITRRAIGVLSAVDLVAAEDTRKTRVLLDHLGISQSLISYFSYNEVRRVGELIRKLQEGSSIALVTDAGTPGVSDPAYVLVREAVAAEVRVIPIPGASALLAALVASGLPMDRFVFEGFLPAKKGRRGRLERIAREERTTVLYESPHRLVRTLEDLAGVLGSRRVAVAREMTKKFEEIVRGTALELSERFRRKEPRGEFVIVVSGGGGSAGLEETQEDTNGNEEDGSAEPEGESSSADL